MLADLRARQKPKATGKVYHADNSLVIEGTEQAYPEKSLAVSLAGSIVTITLADDQTKVLELPYTSILDESDNDFATPALALAYIEQQFSISTLEDRVNQLELDTDGQVAGATPLSYYILAKGT